MASETDARGPGRPPAASREAVEQVALSLMLRDGYDAVTVDAIAAAAGIGRTTFFRYFGSKPGVIWAPFDATIEWLEESLRAQQPGVDALRAVREAVVSSTRSAVSSSDVWLERFQLLDTHPSLSPGAYEHWEKWKEALADHLRNAGPRGPDDAIPMAVAGACHGVFVAALRHWQNTDDDRDGLLRRLDERLEQVCSAFAPLLRDHRL
jgi:AcrR family transcriptional regulator